MDEGRRPRADGRLATLSAPGRIAVKYVLAIVATALALALSLALQRFGTTTSAMVFVGVVVLVARFGGAGPALLSAAISVLLIDYYFIPPIGEIDLQQPEQGVNALVFALVALIVGSTTARLRAAERSMRERADRIAQLQEATSALSRATTVAEVGRVAMSRASKMSPLRRGELLVGGNGDLRVLACFGQVARHQRARPMPSGEERFPLRFGDRSVGVLSLEFADRHEPRNAERALIQLFADATARALVRAQSFDIERQLREAAEQLVHVREQVLGVVAHDLRNPLSAILGAATLLEDADQARSHPREVLGQIRRAVDRMNRLIGDLLDVTRLEAGRMVLEQEPVSVRELLAQTAESWGAASAEHGLTLDVGAAPESLGVFADKNRVLQVLDNLVSNAVKFSEAGGRIDVRADRSDASSEVTFVVSDAGAGIPPEVRKGLFERFWQAKPTDRRGIGLGLAICKGIVEAHGGRIWYESEVGHGTRFTFTLPASHQAPGVRQLPLPDASHH
jgi:K+-sensing histidine kinase KdpD